jgi:hypothetical protein
MKLLAASISSLFHFCYFSQIPGEFVGGGTEMNTQDKKGRG